jgi:PEGA domain
MLKSKLGVLFAIFLALLNAQAQAQNGAATNRKAAIFIEDRTGKKEIAGKDAVLEDLLTSRIGGQGFTVISHQIALNAIAPGQKLDTLLSENTSALRLAQTLGVDFVLAASIATYGVEKRAYEGNGVSTLNEIYTMRLSYKIAEAAQGGVLAGDTINVSKTVRQSAGLQTESSDVVNELLDDAAGRLSDCIANAAAQLTNAVVQAGKVKFSIACSMTDMTQQPLTLPDVQITKDNKLVISTNRVPVQPLDVTVELDGLAIGSAPGTFDAMPGIHKLKLSREGFSTWERTINVFDGQTLKVALQMSEAGYGRWKDNTAFLQALENGRKLTDAEVKVLEGQAKMLSESHYRVDTKENVKIYKSLF